MTFAIAHNAPNAVSAAPADPVSAAVESHRRFSISDAADASGTVVSPDLKLSRTGVLKRRCAKQTPRVAPLNRIAISHEERFSEAEMFGMFGVEVSSRHEVVKDGVTRVFRNRTSLWNVREYPEYAGDDGKSPDDKLSPAVSTAPPGSAERIEALRMFYSAEEPPARGDFPLLEQHAVSPFIGDDA